MMTVRERMLHVYRNEMPDKPAFGIYARYLPDGQIARLARSQGLGVIRYVPLTTQIGPPWHMLPGFLSEVKNTDLKTEYFFDHGRPRERRTYTTPAGSVYEEIGQGVGAGSEYISSYYIKSGRDYEVMRHIVEHTVLAPNRAMFEEAREALGEDGVVLGRLDRTPYQKLLIELAGGEQFLTDLMDGTPELAALLEAMNRRYREEADMAMDSAAEVIWIPDNVTSDMTPPSCYETYHAPLYRYCVESAKQAGKVLAVHYDGKIRPLAPFIRALGFGAVESLSFPCIGGDMTFREAAEAFPGTAILPNFPSNLSIAPEAEIRKFAAALREEAEGYPLMLQISEDLAEGSWKNVIPALTSAMF